MAFNLILGVVLVLLGLFTLLARLFRWSWAFKKHDAMTEHFGPRLGEAVHIVAYTVFPLLAGVGLLVAVFRVN